MRSTRFNSDPCVYIYNTKTYDINNQKPYAIPTLYVDDLMLDESDTAILKILKAVLKILKEEPMGRFATTDMGGISLILGI